MAEIKTEAELLQQNTDTFRDEGSDAHKLKGPTRAAESRGFFGNIISTLFGVIGNIQPVPEGVEWEVMPVITINGTTVSVSAGKAIWDGVSVPYAAATFETTLPANPYQRVDTVFADRAENYGYVTGRIGLVGIDPAIPAGVLPVGNTYWKAQGGDTNSGTTINSTDDIMTEGAANLWFKDARVYLAKAAGYLIQGTTRAIAQGDTLTMILGIFENRLNVNKAATDANAAALQAKADKVNGLVPVAQVPQITISMIKPGDVPALSEAKKAALAVGETNLFTAQKKADGSIEYGAGVQQLNKFAPPGLASLLADSAAGWVGDRITITGDNSAGALGRNAQEFFQGRRWYICETSSATQAVWLRNASIDMLDPASAHDATIIAQLEAEAGWSENIKQLTAKSAKGDEYTSDTGYVYTCYSNDNKWRRIGEPKTNSLFVLNSGPHATLCGKLKAWDFAAADYDALADAGYAGTDLRGVQGQFYYSETTRARFHCVRADSVKVLWIKL